jgi:hypothetical protein
MKELTILCLGCAAGLILAALIANDSNNEPKASKQHPYIYWQDRLHHPSRGFEQAMDMYESPKGDTIYMQRSYGPIEE